MSRERFAFTHAGTIIGAVAGALWVVFIFGDQPMVLGRTAKVALVPMMLGFAIGVIVDGLRERGRFGNGK